MAKSRLPDDLSELTTEKITLLSGLTLLSLTSYVKEEHWDVLHDLEKLVEELANRAK